MSLNPCVPESINPTNETDVFPWFEAGPLSAPPPSAPPSLLSIHAPASSLHSSHVVSQDDIPFHLFMEHYPPLPDGLPLPTGGDVLPSGLDASSPTHVNDQTLQPFEEIWHSTLPPEYLLPICDTVGCQSSGINAPTPSSLKSQQLSLALSVLPYSVHTLSPTSHSYPPPPRPLSTCVSAHQPFIDNDGVKKFQCPRCPKRIRNRLYNFHKHLATHSPDRVLFGCDWPGYGHPPFTRERNLRHHIEKDHLGIPHQPVARIWRAPPKSKGVQEKTHM